MADGCKMAALRRSGKVGVVRHVRSPLLGSKSASDSASRIEQTRIEDCSIFVLC
jgi:hypothetical protein